MGRIWAVSSGSGGVGKSTVALSLACGAAKAGKNVILLDASGIARSCDLVLGLEGMITLDMTDVLSGQVTLDAALYAVSRYSGLKLASASLYEQLPRSELSGVILALHSLCDILVVDLPTGQGSLGSGVMQAEDIHLVIARPDDGSIRSAERLLQTIDDQAQIEIIVNRFSRERGRRGTQHTRETVQAILDTSVIACIPEDMSIPACEQKGRAAVECDGPAWTALKDLLQSLLSA